MALREGYLHDYLVAALIGIAFAVGITSPVARFIDNWGAFIGAIIIGSLVGFLPGGLVAGYLSFRFHQMGDDLEMRGLSVGFFTASVYAVLDLIITVMLAITNQVGASSFFIAWVISVVFAFIFFCLGGYVSGMLERRPLAMPPMFDISRISKPPPPPPGTVMACPSCGGPLRYIQQYQRWYCDKERKYV